MKIWLVLLLLLVLPGCGYSSRDNEAVGQIKKVTRETPLVCYEHNEADISLGVMRSGTGSVSTEDVWYYIEDASVLATLKKAQESGHLVKFHYDVKRVSLCVPFDKITSVEELPN